MNEHKEEIRKAAEVAQFRFGIIAPVIQNLYPDASRTAFYKRVAASPFTLPDGSVVEYNYKTIEKWVSMYQRGGLEALMPHTRSDKGLTRVLPDTAIEEIYRLKKEFPRLNATQIHQHLVADSFIPATVSVCAVQRFIKKNDLKSARNPNMRDRKAFEEDEFGKIWQADTCYFPHITEDGKSRRVYCVMIIDDHSRLLVGGSLFYNDNAYNFQKVLKGGIAACGIPTMLYVDNGVPYANEQLSLICCALGIQLIHTKVRDGASKGCIERLWRTIRMDYEYMTDFTKFHSLEEADESFSAFIRKYNTTVHSAIGCTPQKRYQEDSGRIRLPKSREWMDEQFLNRQIEERRVGKECSEPWG